MCWVVGYEDGGLGWDSRGSCALQGRAILGTSRHVIVALNILLKGVFLRCKHALDTRVLGVHKLADFQVPNGGEVRVEEYVLARSERAHVKQDHPSLLSLRLILVEHGTELR